MHAILCRCPIWAVFLIVSLVIVNKSYAGVPLLSCDYNLNGICDAADYVVWREAASNGATTMPNRGPFSGPVDNRDYDFWRARFGVTTGSGAVVETGVGVSAAPEPSGFLIAVTAFGGYIVAFGRWR